MNTYWQLIKRAFMNSITYRSEVFLWLILDSFPIIILFFVWSSIYQAQNKIGGYNLAAIVQYYLLISIIDSITSSHFEGWRVQEIREGKIDFYLIRPLSYIKELLLRDIGGKLFYISFSLPFFLGIYVLISQLITLPTIELSWQQGVVFIILVGLGYIVEFLFATLIVMVGFWFEYAEGLEQFKWIITSLFSGFMIPIELMPVGLRKVVETLPFKYLFAIPIRVIQQNYTLNLYDWTYILGFCGILFALIRFTWKKAQYTYSSHGG